MFFFQGCVVHFLMLSMQCIMKHPPSSFPRHHFQNFTYWRFCMNVQRMPFFFWSFGPRVHVLFEVHPVCSCLSFSLSNLSAALFGSTTFQLLLIFFRHLSLESTLCSVCNHSLISPTSHKAVVVIIIPWRWLHIGLIYLVVWMDHHWPVCFFITL